MKQLINKFLERFGDQEVSIPNGGLCVIHDCHANPFSSGSNGYITKLRVRNNTLEYYLDWWDYGWKADNKYQDECYKALLMCLIPN